MPLFTVGNLQHRERQTRPTRLTEPFTQKHTAGDAILIQLDVHNQHGETVSKVEIDPSALGNEIIVVEPYLAGTSVAAVTAVSDTTASAAASASPGTSR